MGGGGVGGVMICEGEKEGEGCVCVAMMCVGVCVCVCSIGARNNVQSLTVALCLTALASMVLTG